MMLNSRYKLFILTIFFEILQNNLFRIMPSVNFIPLFLLITIYYLMIYLPELLDMNFLFFIAIFHDIITNNTMFTSLFQLFLVTVTIHKFKHIFTNKYFYIIQFYFLIIIAMYQLSGFIFLKIFTGHSPNLIIFIEQLMITWLVYPSMHKLFSKTLGNND